MTLKATIQFTRMPNRRQDAMLDEVHEKQALERKG